MIKVRRAAIASLPLRQGSRQAPSERKSSTSISCAPSREHSTTHDRQEANRSRRSRDFIVVFKCLMEVCHTHLRDPHGQSERQQREKRHWKQWGEKTPYPNSFTFVVAVGILRDVWGFGGYFFFFYFFF